MRVGPWSNGISALVRRDPRELPHPFWHMRTQCLPIRKQVLTRHQICRQVDLELLRIQKGEREISVVYLSRPAYGILVEQTKLTKTESSFKTEKKVRNKIRSGFGDHERELKHTHSISYESAKALLGICPTEICTYVHQKTCILECSSQPNSKELKTGNNRNVP